MMPVNSIAVARLPDLRLQLFAERDGQLWSTWKTGIGANSAWTPWSRFAPNNDEDFVSFALGQAAPLPSNALQLFAMGGEPNEINVLGGPVLATTKKLDPARTPSGARGNRSGAAPSGRPARPPLAS